MSVEKLVLKCVAYDDKIEIEKVLNNFRIQIDFIDCGGFAYLDRYQAHLLMLYLQEKLTERPNRINYSSASGD